jgi:hypothetical protein
MKWALMLAVLAGAILFFFLDMVSIGVLGSALIVAGSVAAIDLGRYIL